MNDPKRGTGRTTRMLAHAKQLEASGRAVYIIASDHQHAGNLRRLLPEETGIKVETPATAGNFDWQTLALRGAHPNCVVLVDHYAIESHFARMLRMLTAYDLPASSEAA